MGGQISQFPENDVPSDSKKSLDTGGGNFFQRVQQFFKRESLPPEIKLGGRIHELQKKADVVLLELLFFKNEVEGHADAFLFQTICNAIDPIVKEITHIQKAREHQHTATQQVKIYKRYAKWIEKAKKWTNLKNRCHEKDILYQEALLHTIIEFQGRIERDIRVIGDYLDHALNNFEEEDHRGIREKLIQKLSPYMIQLNQLKNPPPHLSLETLNAWRNKADRERETCFSETLHIIDSLISEINPQVPQQDNENDNEFALEILMQLTILEYKIAELAQNLDQIDEDQNSKRIYLTALDKLDEEAYHLNLNLLLPHEYTQRIQLAIETLSDIREELSF